MCGDLDFTAGRYWNPYKEADLLRLFGLSWWRDIEPLRDNDGRLSVGNIQKLLRAFKEREYFFEASLETLGPEDRDYFRQRYRELRSFLRWAVDLEEPVDTMPMSRMPRLQRVHLFLLPLMAAAGALAGYLLFGLR